MAGNPPIKVYQYNKDGKFLKMFDSIQDVRKEYYKEDSGKRPFFRFKSLYTILPDNTIVCKEKVGREFVKHVFKRLSNPFVRLDETSPLIKLFNIDNKVIATFKDIMIASKLTGISYRTIYAQLNTGKKIRKEATNFLLFEYSK